MLESNDMPDGYLKIKVNGGGCTGLTYGMSAEAEPGENDEVLEFFGLKVLVDKHDAPVLNGTTIDFKQSLMGGGFKLIIQMLLLHVVAVVHLELQKLQVIQKIARRYDGFNQ